MILCARSGNTPCLAARRSHFASKQLSARDGSAALPPPLLFCSFRCVAADREGQKGCLALLHGVKA